MNQPKTASKAYTIAMFLAISALCGALLSGLVVPVAALAGGATKLAADSLRYLPAELETPPQSEGSRILMADGSELANFFAENRTYVNFDQISQHMKNAQVAIEDHRFYEHGAIDIEGLGRAIVKTLMGDTQGASTLTQQYVKLVQVETAMSNGDSAGVQAAQVVSIERKIREMRYAMAMEEKLTKDQILERYLNIAYYGDGAYGVEAAAQHYWGISAADLDLAQAAMLAGIVQSPEAYNPVKNTEKAIERRNQVLKRMASAEVGMITQEEAEAAMQVPFDASVVTAKPNGCAVSKFPFLCDYVKRILLSDQMPSMGATPEDRQRRLERGGLTIYTQIDPNAQRAAEDAVANIVGPTDPVWGGSVLIQPSTGLIVAMAQSRTVMGAEEGQTYYNVNVSTGMGGLEGFQAGSTFKPFVLAAALEQGVPTTKAFDSPSPLNARGMVFKNCEGPFTFNSKWDPRNYDKPYGMIDMMQATQQSVNTYFIQLEALVGICNSIDMATKLGVELADGRDMREEASYPSWVLGTSYITPLSMAEAYATFANRGVHCDPIVLRSVMTKQGEELAVPSANCERVMSEEDADGVSYVLSSVMSKGTGTRDRLADGRPQAGKTGTTDDNASVWFAGYTPDMAGVAFIAVDNQTDYDSLKNLRMSTGVYLEGLGGRDAGSIWKTAMASALEGVEPTPFNSPTNKILEGEIVQVPSVAGMGYEAAKRTLEEAGFTVQRWDVPSDRPAGTYLGRISPSTSAPKFSTIRMQFSSGPAPVEEEPTVAPSPTPTEESE